MLALLPELEDAEPRTPLNQVNGPRVGITHAPPELITRIRLVELGKAEPPTLNVDSSTGRLVLLGRPEEALADWLVYRLGSFSTCHARFVTLSTAERNANMKLWTDSQTLGQARLLELLDGTLPAGTPLTDPDAIFRRLDELRLRGQEYPFETENEAEPLDDYEPEEPEEEENP